MRDNDESLEKIRKEKDAYVILPCVIRSNCNFAVEPD